ncbi:hypothetical protein [Bacillus suaedae]|nr:hypothetical protein [Bacillus suaedae]
MTPNKKNEEIINSRLKQTSKSNRIDTVTTGDMALEKATRKALKD